jgi:hypothetical protein
MFRIAVKSNIGLETPIDTTKVVFLGQVKDRCAPAIRLHPQFVRFEILTKGRLNATVDGSAASRESRLSE